MIDEAGAIDPGPETQRPPTIGEQIVGIDFNPGGDPSVSKIKQLAAQMVDIVESERESRAFPASTLKQKLIDAAVFAILQAQMMAVKVVTFKY